MLTRKANIGHMDRKIIIQQQVTTKDTYGQDVATWENFKAVYAKIDDAAGSEGVQADQITATRTSMITIRYAAVDETMRVLYDGDCYNIVSIQRPDRKGYLILKCELKDDQS